MVITPTDDRDLYAAEYFQTYYSNDLRREVMYKQERNRIMTYFPNGGTILDVGCGVGGFLSCFDDRWERYGVEPSEFARNLARKRGVTILQSVQVADFDMFDVCVFRGTLQHIAFPMAALTHAHRALKPGGLLVILATPDTDSIVYKLWGNLPALDAPRNWVLFGSKALVNILQRFGYQDIKVLHPYWGTPYASPLVDFYKFVVSLFFGWRRFAFPGNMMEVYGVKK